MSKPGCCPYCETFHGQLSLLQECAQRCWENRVKPLPHEIRNAVLQSRMTLAVAERQARELGS